MPIETAFDYVRGNTNAAVIAEKAADILLGNEPAEATDRLLEKAFPSFTAGDRP
jgi:hypothetical protein